MRVRGLIVPARSAETVRRRLVRHGWIRRDAGVLREADVVVFPLTEGAEPAPTDGVIEDREFPALHLRPASYQERVEGVPPEVRERLPRAYDVVGDVVVIRLPEAVRPWARNVGEALLAFVPGARQVGWDRGVHGVERRRRIEPIAGVGGFRTTYRENGIAFEVDLERAYFSPRLSGEHARVAAEVRAGERVLDLCCGVGPFSLTIARDGRAREVEAVDLNPDAIELLRSNLERLHLTARVRTHLGDVGEFLRSVPPADRAILNLPHEGIKYLTSVGNRLASGGTLHYYEIMERTHVSERPAALVDALGGGEQWTVEPVRVVHDYAPTSDLVALTFHRRPVEG